MMHQTLTLQPQITVFDFPKILEITERRVRDDLLSAGPRTVEELRTLHSNLKKKYEADLMKRREPKSNMIATTVATVGTTVATVGTTVGTAGASFVERMKTTKVSFQSQLRTQSPPKSMFVEAPDLLSGPPLKSTGNFSIDDDEDL